MHDPQLAYVFHARDYLLEKATGCQLVHLLVLNYIVEKLPSCAKFSYYVVIFIVLVCLIHLYYLWML